MTWEKDCERLTDKDLEGTDHRFSKGIADDSTTIRIKFLSNKSLVLPLHQSAQCVIYEENLNYS
jgi:hypothetical protein